MRYLMLAMLLVALPAYAAESKHDKDVAACTIEADNALAKTTMKSPADVTKIHRDAFIVCMRSKGYAMPPIREK
jgi:hypothetical protein